MIGESHLRPVEDFGAEPNQTELLENPVLRIQDAVKVTKTVRGRQSYFEDIFHFTNFSLPLCR